MEGSRMRTALGSYATCHKRVRTKNFKLDRHTLINSLDLKLSVPVGVNCIEFICWNGNYTAYIINIIGSMFGSEPYTHIQQSNFMPWLAPPAQNGFRSTDVIVTNRPPVTLSQTVLRSHCHKPSSGHIVTNHPSVTLSQTILPSHCHRRYFHHIVTDDTSITLSQTILPSHCHKNLL